MDARIRASVHAMTSDIEAWQQAKRREGRDVTWVGDIKADNFGTWSEPKFGFKGGQTNWYLEWLVEAFLPLKWRGLDQGRSIFRGGQALFRIMSLIRQYKVTFSAAAVQEFHECARRYLEVMDESGVLSKPKDHMLQHQSDRIRVQGSPRIMGTGMAKLLIQTKNYN